MFSLASSTVLALVLASASAHSFSRVRRHHVPRTQPPVGWATGYLEIYDTYHERYLAIGCENKHNTSFFDFCCHPLLATETVKNNRPACCAVGATAACPGASTSSIAASKPTTAASKPTTAASKPTSVASKLTSVASKPTSATTAKATTAVTTAKVTTTAATPTKTASSSGGSFVLGGFGTWFTQNGVAGACGMVHKDTDFVVALETQTYAKGINCDRKIRVINTSNGKSVDGRVADECPSCTNKESVDMSVAMFKALAALSVGEFGIKWEFLD
ncbi:plant expansin [Mycena vulgaris]|nr:plant expansin [Mycena vulgaris]